MREIFEEHDTDAVLLVDASNAFNSLNRQVLLHNIRYICPAMATYVRNCYGTPSRLFITGDKGIASSEGTTQGDPFAMPTYAVGIVPLLSLINEGGTNTASASKVKHAAYADDLGGVGQLMALRWWDRVLHFGPLLGYYPNAAKSWLIVKEAKLQHANELFGDTNIKITSDGHGCLGGYIGTSAAREKYAQEFGSEMGSAALRSFQDCVITTTSCICSFRCWVPT